MNLQDILFHGLHKRGWRFQVEQLHPSIVIYAALENKMVRGRGETFSDALESALVQVLEKEGGIAWAIKNEGAV